MRRMRSVGVLILVLGLLTAALALARLGGLSAAGPPEGGVLARSDGPTADPGGPPAGPDDGAPPGEADYADPLEAVARAVPGFGGMYLGEGGDIVYIYLEDPTQQESAERALAAVYGADLLAGRKVEILTPDYTFAQLQGWYRELGQELWGIRGVTMTDVDEGRNRIVIQVGTAEAGPAVREVVVGLGIPPAAVVVNEPEHPLSEADPLAGCLLQDPPPGPRSSSPIALALSQETVRPGMELTMAISGVDTAGETRGIDSYLECWDGTGWSPRFTLFSTSWTDDHGPQAIFYGLGGAIPAVGFDAATPEPVRLPDQLLPGWYRIRKDFSIRENDRLVDYELFVQFQVAE